MTELLAMYELRSPAAIITMNRADKRNALCRPLIAALHEAFERARNDDAVRCVILAAAGPAFCAGMDLAELSESLGAAARNPLTPYPSPAEGRGELVAPSPAEGRGQRVAAVWGDAQRLSRLYELIYTLPKPTIAAVQGAAVAGGAGLATVCDLALATPEARFGYPEVRRGLVAAMVMPHLLRHVAERTARYLLLTGELIDSAEACRVGMVNAVVPAPALLETAHAWSRSLAEGGPQALARTKALLQQFSRQALSVEETAHESAAPRLTEECQQGLRAFFAKRPAPWAPSAP